MHQNPIKFKQGIEVAESNLHRYSIYMNIILILYFHLCIAYQHDTFLLTLHFFIKFSNENFVHFSRILRADYMTRLFLSP
jgi:hypothetical protein